jgi:hypothetical protein
MADFIFTLKIVVVLLIVCGLLLGISAIIVFNGDKVTFSRNYKIVVTGLLALINAVLLIVGYLAFFAKMG